MARADNPYPSKGPIVFAVVFALMALGMVAQIPQSRTSAVYWLLLVFALAALACGAKAVRDRW